MGALTWEVVDPENVFDTSTLVETEEGFTGTVSEIYGVYNKDFSLRAIDADNQRIYEPNPSGSYFRAISGCRWDAVTLTLAVES